MIEVGLFADEELVELWEGQVVRKMAKSLPHAMSYGLAVEAFFRVLPPGWCVWPENPLVIGPKAVPLPDLTILRGRLKDYWDRHPQASDVGLIVEVAQTSLRTDIGSKLQGYARAGIPAYWVIDLIHSEVRTFADPSDSEAKDRTEIAYRRGQSIPLTLDGVAIPPIPVDDLLPPSPPGR